MQRKEIFKKLEKDIEPRVEYNYKKTAKGIHIMKRTNEATEKVMLKDLVNGFTKLASRFDKLENRFNKFEKKNDQRWENQEAFNSQVFEFMQRQDEFNKNQLEFNKSQQEFNKAIMHRLDNIVTKNNLSE